MSGILGATHEYRSNKYYYDVNEDGDGPAGDDDDWKDIVYGEWE